MGKDIILNVNDGSLLGWKSTIKKIVKNYKNRFLQISYWGDADMINIYDENGNFIKPPYAHKPPLEKDIVNSKNSGVLINLFSQCINIVVQTLFT